MLEEYEENEKERNLKREIQKLKESIRYEKKLQKENKIKLMCEKINEEGYNSVEIVKERKKKGEKYRNKEVNKKTRKNRDKEKGDKVINHWGENEAKKWRISEKLRRLVEKVNLHDERSLKRKLENIFNVDKERKRRIEKKEKMVKVQREYREKW